MKKIFQLLVFITLASSSAIGQQVPYYSQHFVNPYFVNPSYAGQNGTTNLFLNVRQQWVGVIGSPLTQTISVDGPIAKGKMGLGIQVFNDVENILGKSGAYISTAYKVKVSEKQSLRFGVSGGMLQSRIIFERINTEDPTEASIFNNTQTAMYFDANAGVNYTVNKFNIGVSALQLPETKFMYANDFDQKVLKSELVRHFIITAKYNLQKQDGKFRWQPISLIRSSAGLPTQIEMGLTAFYDNTVWVNTTYRHNIGYAVSAGMLIDSRLVVGYNYEYGAGKLGEFSNGSHEFLLGFRFGDGGENSRIRKSDIQRLIDESQDQYEKLDQLIQQNEKLKLELGKQKEKIIEIDKIKDESNNSPEELIEIKEKYGVSVEQLREVKNDLDSTNSYYTVVGSFKSFENSKKFQRNLQRELGLNTQVTSDAKRTWYYVYTKKVESVNQARIELAKVEDLIKQGFIKQKPWIYWQRIKL
jgi:type IX secretion system PorP/SprF family membrane protein